MSNAADDYFDYQRDAETCAIGQEQADAAKASGELSERAVALLRAIKAYPGHSLDTLAEWQRLVGATAFEPEFWELIKLAEADGYVMFMAWTLTAKGAAAIANKAMEAA